MKLRNLCTKRKLKKENEDLRLSERHLKRRLRNEEDLTATLKGEINQYKEENERLWAVISALTEKHSDKDKHSGFECVGVTEVSYE